MIRTNYNKTDYNDTQSTPTLMSKTMRLNNAHILRKIKKSDMQVNKLIHSTDIMGKNMVNDKILEKLEDLYNLVKVSCSNIPELINKNIDKKLGDFAKENETLVKENITLVNESIKKNTNCVTEVNKHMQNTINSNINQMSALKKIENNNKKQQETVEQLSYAISDMQKLCLTISEFALKIDEKLSQYDIDDETESLNEPQHPDTANCKKNELIKSNTENITNSEFLDNEESMQENIEKDKIIQNAYENTAENKYISNINSDDVNNEEESDNQDNGSDEGEDIESDRELGEDVGDAEDEGEDIESDRELDEDVEESDK